VEVGLGSFEHTLVQSENLKIDIYAQYINGVGPDSWVNWQKPAGAYISTMTAQADCLGAVPLFTLYQMATRGDSDLSGLRDAAFMRGYWDNVRLLFKTLQVYGKPVLVNVEPDFWGYAQRQNRDPSKSFVHVRTTTNGDCTHLSDDVIGLTGCLIHMARRYAPQALIGFPPSGFIDVAKDEIAYMQRLGVGQADFTVMQTLDRDVGCFEARFAPDACVRATDAQYWQDGAPAFSATPHPLHSFKAHFAQARRYFEAFGLPLIWWQTPLGVPSAAPGGTAKAFRDNRTAYFLTRTHEIAAAGGVGVVFGNGTANQTSITSDGGQFKKLSHAYLRKPAALLAPIP
jgi:hypothetical protein